METKLHDITLRPRLRGVSHLVAAFVFAALGAVLIVVAPTTKATVAVAVYSASILALFASSAIYHRVRWVTAAARTRMRRMDHSMIYVLIAGSYTPFALLAYGGDFGTVLLVVIWAAALVGVVITLFWIDSPRWLTAGIYLGLGWVAIIGMPILVDRIGWIPTVLVAVSGILYTAGAVIYARKRPNPSPMVFGYHEIFHVLVIAAAAIQFAVVAFWVVPEAT